MATKKTGQLDAKIDELMRSEILAAIRAENTYCGAARRLGLVRSRFYRICHKLWPAMALELRPGPTDEQPDPAPGRTVMHCCVSVRGLLHMSPARMEEESTFLKRGDGTPFASARELREALFDELAAGHEVLPMGKPCKGWDWKTGCPGHRIKDEPRILPALRSSPSEAGNPEPSPPRTEARCN